ncbi:MAG: hypothetical protein LBB61_03495 [Treponema sp.]|jgi:hypothetical protein|nr:hypothetical protein [Treponema sp.]
MIIDTTLLKAEFACQKNKITKYRTYIKSAALYPNECTIGNTEARPVIEMSVDENTCEQGLLRPAGV